MKLLDYDARIFAPLARDMGKISEQEYQLITCLSNWYSYCDRTRKTDIGPDFVYVGSPMPTGLCTQKLADIIDAEAVKLITENKPMALYWSGGIDSTVIVCALLKNKVSRDQLTIVYTDYSVLEYPKFFHEVVSKCQHRKIGPSVFPYVRTDELIVNGNHGDLVWGSVAMFKYVNVGKFKDLFTETWEQYCLFRTNNNEQVASLLEPVVKAAPFPIQTAFDAAWWISTVTKWQSLSYMMSSHVSNVLEYQANVRNFFASAPFELWSYNHQNHLTWKIKNTLESFKFSGKEYCHDWFPDEDYLINKRKVESMPSYCLKPYLCLLEDGTRISAPPELDVEQTVEYFKNPQNIGFDFDQLFRK